MIATPAIELAHKQAQEGAVVVDRSAIGVLKITGETRIDLIHRMSTQDLRPLTASGMGAATILTTEIGRMIDRLLIYATSDTAYVFTGENNADTIARYLMRFVFFNDDFHINDISADTFVLGVYGAESAARLGAADLLTESLDLHHWLAVSLQETTVYVHRTEPIMGDGYLISGDMSEKAAVVAHLNGNGIETVDETQFESLRITAGLPRFGHEIGTDYIPLETGLWDDVSFSKGCYIGQEIIARMESRGKLAKQLVQLKSAELLPAGTELQFDGRKVGTITSVAPSPDGVVALAYIKPAAVDQPLQTDTGIDVAPLGT